MERNFRYIAVALTIAITIGSLISMDSIPKSPVTVSDKFVHTSAYFILALSWLLSFKSKIKSIKTLILILLVIFIYGIIIEVLQAVLTSYRQADYYDMLANLLGISIAGVVFYVIFQKKQQK